MNGNFGVSYLWYDGKEYECKVVSDDVNSVNDTLQQKMIENCHYILSDTGKKIFGLNMIGKTDKIQIQAMCWDGSLPPGWSCPKTTEFAIPYPQIKITDPTLSERLGFQTNTLYPKIIMGVSIATWKFVENEITKPIITIPVKEKAVKVKPRKISQPIRVATWNRYIGVEKRTGLCYVCQSSVDILDFDCSHIIPQSQGGTNSVDNLRCCCRSCNLSCGQQNLDEFRAKIQQSINSTPRQTEQTKSPSQTSKTSETPISSLEKKKPLTKTKQVKAKTKKKMDIDSEEEDELEDSEEENLEGSEEEDDKLITSTKNSNNDEAKTCAENYIFIDEYCMNKGFGPYKWSIIGPFGNVIEHREESNWKTTVVKLKADLKKCKFVCSFQMSWVLSGIKEHPKLADLLNTKQQYDVRLLGIRFMTWYGTQKETTAEFSIGALYDALFGIKIDENDADIHLRTVRRCFFKMKEIGFDIDLFSRPVLPKSVRENPPKLLAKEWQHVISAPVNRKSNKTTVTIEPTSDSMSSELPREPIEEMKLGKPKAKMIKAQNAKDASDAKDYMFVDRFQNGSYVWFIVDPLQNILRVREETRWDEASVSFTSDLEQCGFVCAFTKSIIDAISGVIEKKKQLTKLFKTKKHYVIERLGIRLMNIYGNKSDSQDIVPVTRISFKDMCYALLGLRLDGYISDMNYIHKCFFKMKDIGFDVDLFNQPVLSKDAKTNPPKLLVENWRYDNPSIPELPKNSLENSVE